MIGQECAPAEVLRKVRDGRTVTITYHGAPVAEIRPIGLEVGMEARLDWLRKRGVLVREGREAKRLEAIARRPGALRRFLDERE